MNVVGSVLLKAEDGRPDEARLADQHVSQYNEKVDGENGDRAVRFGLVSVITHAMYSMLY